MRQMDTPGAPSEGVALQHREASDADLHASNLTNWSQQYDQVSQGEFSGHIVELPFEQLQVFREDTSQALQQKCLVWPDSIWLGIPLADQQNCRINGLEVDGTAFMCKPGDHDFQLSTPEQYSLYGMVVQRDALQAMADIHGYELANVWQEGPGRHQIPEKVLNDARYILARMLNDQDERGRNRLSREVLMLTVLELLKEEQPAPSDTPSFQHRKQVVDTVQGLIASQPDRAFTVTELCEQANVSSRTLQYSFQSILGISPIRYLRVSRLNGVRRALLQAPEGSSVADIATQWGFWHLSQFAKDYKLQFGELPSETINTRRLLNQRLGQW